MNEQSRDALKAYYTDAESWNRDRQDLLRASRRLAWRVAAALGVIAVLEAFALIMLAPLKTVVPYTLLVDRNTGFVQALKPLDADKVAPDTALTQSFLVQYVIGRESYDIDTLDANYRKVALWSAENARTGYVAGMQVGSPDSPLTLYPRSTTIETRVKSVSAIGRNVALVRFDTVRHDAGGAVQPARSWVSVIRYRFSGEPMRLEDRFVNPLGFQVLRYRRDAEAIAPDAVTVAAPVGVVTAVPGPASVTVVTPTMTTTTTAAPASALGAANAAARAKVTRPRPTVPEPEL
jgi:type IV secretion system protein VirB8